MQYMDDVKMIGNEAATYKMVLDTCIEQINCTDEQVLYGDLPGYISTIQECNKSLQKHLNDAIDAIKALSDIGVLEDGILGDHGGIPEAQAKARAILFKSAA